MKEPPPNIAGYDPRRDADGFTWNPKAAANIVAFFSEALKLTSGRSAGKPFILEPWQRDYVATLYGWQRKDGTRRYRESLFFVPRKNGKTETGAGIALYGLCCDNEGKPEVYSAAKTRDQASRVFEPAAIMVRNSGLSAYLKVVESQKRISFSRSNGYYNAISADAATAHGKNPHLVLFDELHTQPNRNLYDGLKSGMGARTQPLFVSMTTAGHDRHSICYEVWNHAKQVRDGIIKDAEFLPMLYQFEEGDDWSNPEVWRRCNPNLGVTITEEFLQSEFARAQTTPAYENTFRNLYLNQWTEQAVRWLSMDRWDACESELPHGEICFAGLDLSTTTDITALVVVWPYDDRVVCRPYFWVPEEAARERSLRDRVPYTQWIKDGYIFATPGRSVDYDFIRRDVVRLCNQHNVQKLAIDRWNATQLATQLEKQDGVALGYWGQGFASMSAPAKMLETLVVDGRLLHDGNPVLRWMAANVSTETDAAGNIKPNKAKSTERIDGIVALIMALGVYDKAAEWTPEEIGI